MSRVFQLSSNRSAHPKDVGDGVDKWRVCQRQVDAQQDVEDALVGWGSPLVYQQVVVGVRAPARGAKESQQKVYDEADHCTYHREYAQ